MNRRFNSVEESNEDVVYGALAEVIAVGEVDEVAVAVVVAHLRTMMALPTRVGPCWRDSSLPSKATSIPYDAELLTRRLAEDRLPNQVRLGVTELDLRSPIFSHVYGEAEIGGGVAVVSIYRLRGDAAPRATVYSRLAKVACHEVGHALGLRHCSRSDCLMCFVARLGALDRLVLEFCADCRAGLSVGKALIANRRALP